MKLPKQPKINKPKPAYLAKTVPDTFFSLVQQNQHAVLIVVQLAVVGGIALAAVFVESFKQRSKPIKVLQACDVLASDLWRVSSIAS